MPVTSKGITSPDPGTGFMPVTDLAAMAASIDTAITTAISAVEDGANFYKGTAAQRAAFLPTAENGDAWMDTDGSRGLYTKSGSAWVEVGDNRQREERTVTASLSGTESAVPSVWFRNFAKINFQNPFPSTPHLLVTTVTDSAAVQVNSVVAVDATGFIMRGMRFQAAGVLAPVVHYQAVLL